MLGKTAAAALVRCEAVTLLVHAEWVERQARGRQYGHSEEYFDWLLTGP